MGHSHESIESSMNLLKFFIKNTPVDILSYVKWPLIIFTLVLRQVCVPMLCKKKRKSKNSEAKHRT